MNILLTGAFNYTENQLSQIESLGFDITYIKEERETLDMDVSEFEVVVCNQLFIYNDIKKFKKLKIIQLTSAGLDRVPLDYIKENNIKLYNARGVYSIPIAEYVIGKILEIYKNSRTYYYQQQKKIWKKNHTMMELTNKNIAILGYGSIGKELAKRLKVFNTKIYAFDIRRHQNDHVDYSLDVCHFNNYLPEMDIVILTMPLTVATKEFIDYEKLKMFKDGSILINVSRGQLICFSDLIKYLELNKNFNLVLDVFDNEPLDDTNVIWTYKNVYITPHISYSSDKISSRIFNLILENLKKISCC